MDDFFIVLAVTLAASFLGGFVQRVSGFGYGIVVMMFFPYVLSLQNATALSGAVCILQALIIVVAFKDKIRLAQVIIPLIPYTLTSLAGTIIIKNGDTSALKRILGGFLIVLSVYFFIFASKIKIKATVPNALIAGSLSGIMSGLFAMGGPPMVVYYLSATDTNDEYLATIHCYFLFSNIIATVMRAATGAFNTKTLILIIPVALSMLLATYLGKKVYTKLSSTSLKKAIYAFMALSGALALFGK